MKPLRILLVDDQILCRRGIAALLSSRQDMIVVGETADGLEAVAQAGRVRPDVVLTEINIPSCSGFEITGRIKKELPQVKVVILTVSDQGHDLLAAIKCGVDGYLLKKVEPDQLFATLEGVRQGGTFIPNELALQMLQELIRPEKRLSSAWQVQEELTPREVQVLERVVDGANNKEIAEALCIAENTVKIHLRSIMEKLRVENRLQAAVFAVRHKLIPDSSTRSSLHGLF